MKISRVSPERVKKKKASITDSNIFPSKLNAHRRNFFAKKWSLALAVTVAGALTSYGFSPVASIANDEPIAITAQANQTAQVVEQAVNNTPGIDSGTGELLPQEVKQQEVVADSVDGVSTVVDTNVEDNKLSVTAGLDESTARDGLGLNIDIPVAEGSKPAEKASDGTIVLSEAQKSTDVAVQNFEDGTRIQKVIKDSSAPTEYSYKVNVPAGSRLEVNQEGGVDLVGETPKIDSSGEITAERELIKEKIAEPAWATDAAGKKVATHYKVEGNSIVQVVEHNTQEGVLYPVVADPFWVFFLVIVKLFVLPIIAAIVGPIVDKQIRESIRNRRNRVCQIYPKVGARRGWC